MSTKRRTSQRKLPGIEPLIKEMRSQKVILDSDLACLYGVPTKRLNEQVKRNRKRFPEDFMFRLTRDEHKSLISQISISKNVDRSRSQFATLKRGKNIKYLPYVFSENGAVMAANVLNSTAAVRMSVFVVRAFVRMREIFAGRRELAEELAVLDKRLTGRLDLHETAIVDIIKRIMTIIDPPLPPLEPPKRRIGFHQ
ncbi:MAG: ORF6N domain-containing protein [Candidatus Omnitrophica bacterium]|nr:ORF6N domain-containing protein [Candidatus Omnitrophota bacterium]